MVTNLRETIRTFSSEIKESTPDYVSIYTYFLDYINNIAYSKDDISLEEFLKNEFSKGDLINSCVWYFENSNAKSITAIEKYLNSMTKFYTSFMKPNNYDNKNLFAILPFSQLKSEVSLKIKNKELTNKQAFPSIKDDDFKMIRSYLNEPSKQSITSKQISIIFKLMMLFGLKFEKIKYIEKKDFDSTQRLLTLKIEYDKPDDKSLILELPSSLTMEITNYLSDPRCNKTSYMFVTANNKIITPAFLDNGFKSIKANYSVSENGNKFTSTGLAKYAITNMLKAGINVPVIKMITGMEDDVINDCTKIVYELDKPIKLNRYINSKLRSIDTYDEIGI